ncbi:MAG: hypothetical protein QOH96_3704 [Blastocatellia bacterium]|nr:hypothetical protein [Blastocatellia bacterium]
MRRLFISQLRQIYPNVPILILRRDRISVAESTEWIRCEFILGDHVNDNDCEIVQAVREIMPIKPCAHVQRDRDFDTLRDVISALAERYSDSALDLTAIAIKMRMSPKRLSMILNENVGVSFRQLLRNAFPRIRSSSAAAPGCYSRSTPPLTGCISRLLDRKQNAFYM